MRAPPGWLTPLAIAIAIAAPGCMALGLFGMKFAWLPYSTSEFLIRSAAVPLALAAVALGLVAAVFELVARRGRVLFPVLAILIAVTTWGVLASQSAYEGRFPPIHDVSTTWETPPMPSATLATERSMETALPVLKTPIVAQGTVGGVFAGRTVAEVNASTCKAAVPVTLTSTPAEAYGKALAAVKGKGLRVVVADPVTDSIDAVADNFWNMKEDVMVRVRAEGAGARIDLRSISRHGENDRGHNCRRVGQLRDELAAGH